MTIPVAEAHISGRAVLLMIDLNRSLSVMSNRGSPLTHQALCVIVKGLVQKLNLKTPFNTAKGPGNK